MNFIEYLSNRLEKELPGIEAQKLMAPMIGKLLFRSFKPKTNSRTSSVLVLLYPHVKENNYNILLTLRSKKISHSGQISFPGGRSELNETPVETALRETWEEVGLASDNIQILGQLTELYVPPSNSIIFPVVGYLDNEPILNNINKHEVNEIVITDLQHLQNDNNLMIKKWKLLNRLVDVPHWTIHPTTPLWGATAMMLMELLTIYNDYCQIN